MIKQSFVNINKEHHGGFVFKCKTETGTINAEAVFVKGVLLPAITACTEERFRVQKVVFGIPNGEVSSIGTANVLGSGGVLASGDASSELLLQGLASGGVLASGDASSELLLQSLASGGVVVGGSETNQIIYNIVGSGGSEVAGDGVDEIDFSTFALVPMYGQSLATGSDADTQSATILGSGTTGAYTNETYMFNGGLRPQGTPSNNPLDLVEISSIVTPSFEETDDGGNYTETGLQRFMQEIRDAESYDQIGSWTNALGAASWGNRTGVSTDKDGLQPSTVQWANLAGSLYKFYQLATSATSSRVEIPYLIWNQGEAEVAIATSESETDSETQTRVIENIRQLSESFTFLVRQITGDQTALPKILLYLKPLSGGANAGAIENARSVAEGMQRACTILPRVIAIDPEYVSGNYTDGVHKTATGYNLNGFYASQAVLRDLNSEETDPLTATSVAYDSTSITIDCNDTLTTDTITVAGLTDLGITVSSGTISNVNVSGNQILITGSGFDANTVVYYALESRNPAVDTTGGNIKSDNLTRPRWLAPFKIDTVSTFTPSTEEADFTVAAYTNRDVTIDARNVPAYTHSLTANQQTIADDYRLATWYKADVALEDVANSQTHCFGKTGANWALPESGISRETIDSREFIVGFDGTSHVDGPNVLPVGQPFTIYIYALQPQIAASRFWVGNRWIGSNNYQSGGVLIFNKRPRLFLNSGVNGFSSNALEQYADDTIPHLVTMIYDPFESVEANSARYRIDNGPWNNAGTASTLGQLPVNATTRIGNQGGANPATDGKVSDVLIFQGVADDASFASIDAAILSEFGF